MWALGTARSIGPTGRWDEPPRNGFLLLPTWKKKKLTTLIRSQTFSGGLNFYAPVFEEQMHEPYLPKQNISWQHSFGRACCTRPKHGERTWAFLCFTWRMWELPYRRILKFGGNGPPDVSDGIESLHKAWLVASGSHLGYAGLLWVGQKYLVKTRLTAGGRWTQGLRGGSFLCSAG